MVTQEEVEKQLKKLKFNYHGWGKAEIRELPHLLVPGEEMYELVNGTYEGGFALLLASNIRILLIDKKPLNYLTVEDFRFDMINEIDYSHRLLGAQITVSTGSKTLRFRSYNQQRLRKLIGHVQHCMAEGKQKQTEHAEDQKLHLEQINQQLQAYLLAQHKQQQELQKRLEEVKEAGAQGKALKVELPEPPKAPPAVSDALLAQALLEKYKEEHPADTVDQLEAADQKQLPAQSAVAHEEDTAPIRTPVDRSAELQTSQLADLYAEGMKEVFGSRPSSAQPKPQAALNTTKTHKPHLSLPARVDPLTIAYSKLPLALRNRKFGRPSFHAHSQAANS